MSEKRDPVYWRDLRRNLKERGICSVCRNKPVAPKRTKCRDCGARDAANTQRLKAERKRDGTCIDCGRPFLNDKNLHGGRYTRCPRCHYFHMLNSNNYNAMRRRRG